MSIVLEVVSICIVKAHCDTDVSCSCFSVDYFGFEWTFVFVLNMVNMGLQIDVYSPVCSTNI